MKENDDIFSEDYVKSDGKVDPHKEETSNPEINIETEKYGTSKPTRINIKARIAHD